MCQDVPGCARMCQGVKSIKSVASLSRTFAASSIGSMKPKPFFSLNLRTWHLVWPQECQMQDEQQNSSKTPMQQSLHTIPSPRLWGLGKLGGVSRRLQWHRLDIAQSLRPSRDSTQAARPSHSATQERSFILHLRSEAAKQDGNWVDSVDLSDLFGVLRACSLPFAGASAYIDILSILTLWHHYGIIVAGVMDADGTCSVRWQPTSFRDCGLHRVPGWQFSRFIQDYTNLSGRPWWQTR